MLTIAQLETLPVHHRTTITTDHLDALGHMNVRWYMAIFDEGVWQLFESLGMERSYYEERASGPMALRQFIQYFAEVRDGETVAVRVRLLARSEKRIHFVKFMVNETMGVLAASLESVATHADLSARRSSPWPPDIAQAIDATLAVHKRLTWDAPLSGAIIL